MTFQRSQTMPTPSPSASSSSYSLSKRNRSGSRPTTPTTKAFYGTRPTPSRSKSNTPHPKVLPFPDLPLRPTSRDGSRATSPTSTPLISPRGSHVEITALMLIGGTPMSRNTSEGAGGSWSAAGASGASTSYETTTSINSPTSPSVPSPLRANNSASTPHLPISEAGPSRFRSQTTSTLPRQESAATMIASSSSTPPTLAPPTRIQGFRPRPVSPVVVTSSPSASPVNRPGSLPTPVAVPAPSTSLMPLQSAKELPKLPQPVKKLSNPVPPPSFATAITPIPPSTPLTNHLYQAFLKGTCADVRLYVRKWGVGWKVHKMVLVQAGFFHSLFLGGFSETSAPIFGAKRKGKEKALFEDEEDWAGEDIELQFDDPNITRAAFEICLSRLYSSYPQLQFPISLLPTPSHPLTPTFDAIPTTSLHSIHESLPVHTQLATPRLLLSLLATTIYLGHASLMREVLSMVLRTVGPATVCRYVNFAMGDGIGEAEWERQDLEGARGLSEIAKPLRGSGSNTPLEHDEVEELVEGNSHRNSADSSGSYTKSGDDGSKVSGTSTTTISRAISSASSRTIRGPNASMSFASPSPQTGSSIFDESRMPHFYGFASNKIGEACTCWLTRWGMDILRDESKSTTAASRYKVWGHGGIPTKIARAVLSADALFVRDEMERYRAARLVLDVRMRAYDDMAEGGALSFLGEDELDEDSGMHDEWEEEESELMKVFADGIYYTHMTFEDLSAIAADIDPHSSLPYAPLNMLQAAHWSAADLKTRLVNPATESSELGVTQTTTEIASPLSARRRKPRSRVVSPSASSQFSSDQSLPSLSSATVTGKLDQMYHPIPTDDTHRIGAGGLPFLNALAAANTPLPGISGIPDLGPINDLDLHDQASAAAAASSTSATPAPKSKPKPPHDEKTQFGLSRPSRSLTEIYQATSAAAFPSYPFSHLTPSTGIREPISPSTKWSKLEPFRFSVEFFNVHLLAERERAYSTTHFYAGSWFNVYVQTIRKKDKGVQLGIYLHRQNPDEPFPQPSSPASGASGIKMQDDDQPAPGLGISSVQANRVGLEVEDAARLSRQMSGLGLAGSPGGNVNIFPGLTREVGGETANEDSAGRNGEEQRAEEAYRDIRPVTKAYFSISCASALGTALIRFSSAPDSFTLSQSWGWKSSALRSEEYLSGVGSSISAGGGGSESLEDGVLGWVGDVPGGVGAGAGGGVGGGSLRASVVVGVV